MVRKKKRKLKGGALTFAERKKATEKVESVINQSVKHFKNFIVRFDLVLSYTISIVLNTPLD